MKPKYQIGDIVVFTIFLDSKKTKQVGRVEFINKSKLPILGQHSYDILVDDFNHEGRCMCGQIPEGKIRRKN